jgi:hypothetical protein
MVLAHRLRDKMMHVSLNSRGVQQDGIEMGIDVLGASSGMSVIPDI